MKTLLFVLPVALAALLVGCATPQVTTPVRAAVDIHQFNTATLVVVDGVNTPFSREGLPMFEGLLKGRMQSAGYTMVDSNAQMVVEVTVNEFTPGNRALRMTVGLGAGRALFKYTARFKNSRGNLLAELEGGKAYTGMELADNANLKSDESIRMGLISYPVSQIGAFIGPKQFARQARNPLAP